MGITNRCLRERVCALFDAGPKGYTQGRMTYDLRRLRLKGLVERLPHSQRYVLTPLGRRVACNASTRRYRTTRLIRSATPGACEQALDSAITDARMAP